jgi:hypothetical protein
MVGAHFGMTPKKYQSGAIDVTGRICKMGDKGVRAALYEAAHVILTTPVKGGALKSWAAKLRDELREGWCLSCPKSAECFSFRGVAAWEQFLCSAERRFSIPA